MFVVVTWGLGAKSETESLGLVWGGLISVLEAGKCDYNSTGKWASARENKGERSPSVACSLQEGKGRCQEWARTWQLLEAARPWEESLGSVDWDGPATFTLQSHLYQLVVCTAYVHKPGFAKLRFIPGSLSSTKSAFQCWYQVCVQQRTLGNRHCEAQPWSGQNCTNQGGTSSRLGCQ